jgi:hypothetical protein
MAKKKTTRKKANGKDDRDGKGRFTKGNDAGFSSRPDDINRKGRPHRPSLTAALLRRLNAEGNDHQASGKKVADALVDATLKAALEGSFMHLKEVWNRLDGLGNSQPVISENALPITEHEHKEAALRLYQAIIEDPLSSHRDRLAAQEGIVRLLGLIDAESTPEEAAKAIQRAMSEMLGVTMAETVDDTKDDDKPAP